MARKTEKLVIALDPFASEKRRLGNAAASLNKLIHQAGFEASAASVVTPEFVSWPASFPPDLSSAMEAAGKAALDKLVANLGLNLKRRSKSLVETHRSRSSAAGMLAQSAVDDGMNMIAVITHLNERAGFAPLGGFAEALMSRSRVPVLAINRRAKAISRFSTVLFATDFSDECKRAFADLLPLAKRLGARVRLYHRFFTPIEPMFVTGSPFVPPQALLDSYLEDHEHETRSQAEAWIALGKQSGVEVDFVLDKASGGVVERILAESHGRGERSADLIALAPQTGTIAARILGSTSRAVLNLSKKPVLLLLSKPEMKGDMYVAQQGRKAHDNKTSHHRASRFT